MQKRLIIANWKMNPLSQKEAEHLFEVVKKGIKEIENVETVICPPFIYLLSFKLQPASSKILALGAQNCHWEQKGAYTGDISPLMLRESGCQYVIIGHSERRKYFGETDELINKKLKSSLRAGLRPILCIGEETRDTFDSRGRPLNEMSLVVGEQLEKALDGISLGRIRDIVVAYEPIWAISTNDGRSCLPISAMQANLFIKKILSKLYNRQIAGQVKVVYGGSVNAKNAESYIKEAGMDGLLIGAASLNASEFLKIIKRVNNSFYENPPRF